MSYNDDDYDDDDEEQVVLGVTHGWHGPGWYIEDVLFVPGEPTFGKYVRDYVWQEFGFDPGESLVYYADEIDYADNMPVVIIFVG